LKQEVKVTKASAATVPSTTKDSQGDAEIRPGAGLNIPEKPVFKFSEVQEPVLLVDDDPSILALLNRYVTAYGLQADLARNGREAVACLKNRHYGLLITDIMMPEMNGMELIDYVSRHHAQTDILAVSGFSDRYSFSDLVAAGATEFIAKPFQGGELEAKLLRIFRERRLRCRLATSREKEKTFFLNIVDSLARALDEKDEYTHGHARRVTNLSLQLVAQAQGNDIDRETLRLSGILHDIGKIGVPDSILRKTGKLNDDEFRVIKKHPEQGADILQPMGSDRRMAEISRIIRHHHERYDGRGHPDGLKGEEIPYCSRIIAIADSYDAMTSDRPYRKGMAVTAALEEIRINSGSQFDPLLAKKFVHMIESCAESANCPVAVMCGLFSKDPDKAMLQIYKKQYCRENFTACARFNRIRSNEIISSDLLPDGSLLLPV